MSIEEKIIKFLKNNYRYTTTFDFLDIKISKVLTQSLIDKMKNYYII